MPDLKLDVETAVKTIGRELDRSIENLRGTASSLIDDLKSVAETLDGPMRVSIADADAACVLDFTTDNYTNRRHLTLRPLPPGKYRAVILLNKIGE